MCYDFYMIWRQSLSTLWGILLLPSLFFLLLSTICDDPNGCMYTGAELTFVNLIRWSPLVLLMGTIVGWFPIRYSYITLPVLILPAVYFCVLLIFMLLRSHS